MIENMKNGTIKHPERFPNPRIIEITDSFRKFVEKTFCGHCGEH